MGGLGCAPAVECLTDDEHADGVAGVKESARRGVMARADEVEARIFHLAHLSDFGCVEGHGTEDAVVVVHAGPVDKHGLSVEHESPFGIERERTHAEA